MRSYLLIAVGLATAACGHDDLEVAPEVDLQRFEGKWHEIAHLPRPTQKDCTGTVATYTRQADGTLEFTHECTLGDGSYYGKTAIAKTRDPRIPAKLAVDFGGYIGDYWILDVAPDYRYAVVGHPSRDYLWILSRTPTLSNEDRDSALAHAEQKGFDTKRLEYTPRAPEPSGTPAPPVKYGVGCAATGVPSTASLGGAVAIAGMLLVAWRRRRRSSHAC
jgi:apolipoprotein D and lipocalin family protein